MDERSNRLLTRAANLAYFSVVALATIPDPRDEDAMDFFWRWTTSIKAKLLLVFTFISLIVLAAGVSSIIPFYRLEKSMRQIGHDNIQSLLRISDIKEAKAQIMVAERTLLIRQLADHNLRQENYSNIEKAYHNANNAANGFENFSLTHDQLLAWNSFRRYWDSCTAKHDELMDILRKQEELLDQGVREGSQFDRIANQAFDLAFSELRELRNDANNSLDSLVIMIRDGAVTAMNESLHVAQSNIRNQIFFVLATFLGALTLSFWLSIRISRPILQSVSHITQVANGNIRQNIEPSMLTQRGEIGLLVNAIQKLIESNRRETVVFKSIANGDYTSLVELRSNQDELGLAVGQMLNVTNEALGKVNSAVTQVTLSASAINNASQSLSEGAIEIASSLEEISASICQIGEKTKANAASADEADKLAASSRNAVDKGYDAVAELIAAMKDIQAISTQIASVVKLIDDIAFQTNLLALNAAVEAARAGRHGRGFSIVADEVRSLAGRSAKAAKDTASMLEQTVIKLEKGANLAEHTDSVLREIVDNAVKVADLFREIAKSSNEQSLGISQIASGLSQIDRVTQHNTLTASETASAAIALFQQAEGLGTMMKRFRLRGAQTGREMRMEKSPPAKPEPLPTRINLTAEPISNALPSPNRWSGPDTK